MIKTKSFLIVGLAFAMAAVTSCKEANLFDEEDYNRYVDIVFPVENIDSQQSWSTTYKYPFRIGIEYEKEYSKVSFFLCKMKRKSKKRSFISIFFITLHHNLN